MPSLKNNIFFLITYLFAGCVLFTGCCYQFGPGELAQRYATFSIPFIEGDQKGELTTEVIRRLSSSGAFQYVNDGGELILKIRLIDLRDENIDFRYDRKKSGKLKRSLIPTGTRLIATAEVAVIETGTGQSVRGPTEISARIDFDHTYYSTRDKINVFSLGQLNDIDAAREAAMHPLNRVLAKNIVDYLLNSW